MTIQQIIAAVFKVYDPADAPSAKGRRNQLSSARRVVAHLAKAHLPSLSLSEIRDALHMHAHSSVYAMLSRSLELPEAKAFAAAERELGVGKAETIPAPASVPRMTDKAREIIGALNADEDTRRDVLVYLRRAMAEPPPTRIPLGIPQESWDRYMESADAAHPPATVQGVTK